MIRYTCKHELLPMIEGALAANGYMVEASMSRQTKTSSLIVMTYGDGGVLLAHNRCGDLAEVDIWGAAQSAASRLLESLPLALEKRSSAALVQN
jgi:hypothetical protein